MLRPNTHTCLNAVAQYTQNNIVIGRACVRVVVVVNVVMDGLVLDYVKGRRRPRRQRFAEIQLCFILQYNSASN